MSQHFFWAERLFVNSRISVHIYDHDGVLLERVGIKERDEDPFLSDPSLYGTIREKQRAKAMPLLLTEDGWAAYAAFGDMTGNFYIAGPVNIALSSREEKGELHYCDKNVQNCTA